MRAPAALLAVPLFAGACGGLLFADNTPAHFDVAAAVAACFALLAALTSFADDRAPECAGAIVIGAFLTGISLANGAADRAYHSPLLTWFLAAGSEASLPVQLQGRLREDAVLTSTGVSLTLDVHSLGACERGARSCRSGALGGVRLSVAGSLALDHRFPWRAGRLVRVMATLREPTVYLNPGVPDDRRALARRGVALVGSVKSAALVEVIRHGSLLDEAAAAGRGWIRTTLAATVEPWGARSGAVARAILIGDRSALTEDDERRLQAAGTYHVIAISGGNIAILTVLVLATLRALRVPSRVTAGAAMALLLVYSRVVVPAPSVERAIMAALIYLGGRLLDHRGPPLNVLGIAAIAALGASPTTAFDPGFILSFGATLGILILVPRVMRGRTSWYVRGVVGLLAATAAAEIVLGPFGAAVFSRITFAGLVLNFAAIPLMTVVQAASLIAVSLWPLVPDAGSAAGYLAHLAAVGLVDSARLVDLAPWLSREVSPPSWWLLGFYYAALAMAVVCAPVRRVATFTVVAAGLLIVADHRATARDGIEAPPAGSLRVVFLDVGQGDATLLALPDGRAFVVDAGGLPPAPLQDPADGPSFDLGERVVAPSLRAMGVRRVDTFILTHADSDHIGGAPALLRSFQARSVWEGAPVPPHAPLQTLMADAERLGAEWRTVVRGDGLRIAGVDIRILHPPVPDWERQRVRNEDSVVAAIRLGRVSIILPGDIGREGEAQAIRFFEPAPIVVLKAPHHGSATSSTPELLAAMRPAAVIFSAGRANRFGHPAPTVVARYRALGITMFSTAEDGAVILDTDGRTVTIRGWASDKVWHTGARADGETR
jgi:competence protein ComEC